jgi:hypothetical protein
MGNISATVSWGGRDRDERDIFGTHTKGKIILVIQECQVFSRIGIPFKFTHRVSVSLGTRNICMVPPILVQVV